MDEDKTSPRRSGRLWAGLFLVLVGTVIVLDRMGFPLPYWLFTWQTFLIALGLFIGFKHNFRGGFWLILILVGAAFEFQDYYPKYEIHRFILPGVLILVGIIFVLNPGRHDRWGGGPWHNKGPWHDKDWKRQWKHQWKYERHARKWGYNPGPNPNQPNPGPGTFGPGTSNPGDIPGTGAFGPGTSNPGPGTINPGPGAFSPGTGNPGPGAFGPGTSNPGAAGSTTNSGDPANPSGTTASGSGYSGYSAEDFIDTTAFFGGVHKKIVSKSFKGGDIVTIMGGTEIDLSQADFTGMARLDVVQIMGATKIIVPAHWEVRTDVTAIFAGFEDKRQQPTVNNPEKVLLIDGTSLMGGIELRNF